MRRYRKIDPRFWKAAEPFVALRLDGSDPDDPIYDASYKTYGLVGPTHNYAGLSFGNIASVMKSKVVWNQTKTVNTMKHRGSATGDEARKK